MSGLRVAGVGLVLLVVGGFAVPAGAQDRPPASRPRIGVALSGGGVKGFAHVGVLRVVESVGLPVDVVTGTSMGGFIGALYAVGYSVDQLDSLLHAVDWRSPFEESSSRRKQPLEYRLAEEGQLLSLPVRGRQLELPRGLNSGQSISEVLSDLLFPAWEVRDFRRLPRSFGALAADLSDGEGVLLTSGHLPDAIRASTAIPSVFEPVVIDGRTFIDGGVTRNLPAEDARALGADAVICVDVGEPVLPVDSLDTFLDVMVQALGFRVLESTRKQHRLCDVLIRPEVTGVGSFDFDRTEDLIRRGEEAARLVEGELSMLRDSLYGLSGPPAQRPTSLLDRPDSVFVAEVRIDGAVGTNEAVIRRAMRLSVPGYLSKNDLEEAVQRAYNTQRFRRVTYRLDPIGGGAAGSSEARLLIQAAEGDGDRLAVGLRYDSDYQASVLMRITLSDVLGSNQRLVGSLRLGEVVRLGATLTTPLGFGPRARIVTEVEAGRTPIDLFEGGTRTSELAAHTVEVGLGAGGPLLPDLAATIGIRAELFDIDPRIAGDPGGVSFDFLDETNSLVFGEARFYLDTFDRVSFPSTGARFMGRSMLTIGALSSDRFGQHWIDAEGRIPLGPRVSVSGRVAAGVTIGDSTPIHYRFFAGGPFPVSIRSSRQLPLLGHELQEVSGRDIRAVWAGFQVEVREDVFVGGMWNAASVAEDWSWQIEPDDFVGGVGFLAGFRTVVGPVLVMLTSSGIDGPYELHLSVGHYF